MRRNDHSVNSNPRPKQTTANCVRNVGYVLSSLRDFENVSNDKAIRHRLLRRNVNGTMLVSDSETSDVSGRKSEFGDVPPLQILSGRPLVRRRDVQCR